MSHSSHVSALVKSIDGFSKEHGEDLVRSMEEAAELLLLWHSHLGNFGLTKTADELLLATGAAVREAAALAAIGAVRPCLFSLRAQVDLILGWIYFKDHPIEYSLLQRTGDGFKLKRDVLLYLKESFPGYGERIGILTQVPTRKELDPYRLLSAHIHAQSSYVIPKVDALRDVICAFPVASECVQIQRDISEFVSDHLFSSGIFGYNSLPPEITSSIKARAVTAAQRAVLFS